MKYITPIEHDKGYSLAIGRKAPWDRVQVPVPKWIAKLFMSSNR